MRRKKMILQKLLDYGDLSDENLPRRTVIELLGDSRIFVENHRRIMQYGLDEIWLGADYGTVKISGGNLQLRHVSRQKLMITGSIHQIAILRRDGN